ncbi:MAG: hypothetical protein ACFCA4_12700 [Cyanophyceae cyanobacterium]
MNDLRDQLMRMAGETQWRYRDLLGEVIPSPDNGSPFATGMLAALGMELDKEDAIAQTEKDARRATAEGLPRLPVHTLSNVPSDYFPVSVEELEILLGRKSPTTRPLCHLLVPG